MRVIHKPEIQINCVKCSSLIGFMAHELCEVPPMGPYDMDYDENVGRKYWDCPVCKTRNWYGSSRDDDYKYI